MRYHPGSGIPANKFQQPYFNACVVMPMKLHCKVPTFPITIFGYCTKIECNFHESLIDIITRGRNKHKLRETGCLTIDVTAQQLKEAI
jgi:hypothetical protein